MMLRIFLVLLVCLVATVVESVFPFLFGLSRARADLLLSVVLYLALNDEVVMGAGLSALAGYLGELGSATPVGLYTFLRCSPGRWSASPRAASAPREARSLP